MHYIFAAIALWLIAPRIWRQIGGWKNQSEAERSFAIRFTVFVWVLGFLFVVALLFLPNKGRVLLMVPLFLATTTLAKWWQTSRDRLRRNADADTNFERARRIN